MTHLTMTCHTTLIKATLNTIPNYIMQFISLPAHIITRLESYQKNFLWDSTSQKRRLHLLKWDKISTPKEQGGLGIQWLRDKNDALLASTAWKLFHIPRGPWAAFLISKYITMRRHPLKRTSTLWKHIINGWNTCQNGSFWHVTRGTHVLFWTDNWMAPNTNIRNLI